MKFPKSRPWRCEIYLDWVREKSCMHCYAPPPSEAHHWAPTGNKGTGRKVDDCFTVPLCTVCHRTFHDRGTLPGLTPELARSDFEREILRLLADYVRGY